MGSDTDFRTGRGLGDVTGFSSTIRKGSDLGDVIDLGSGLRIGVGSGFRIGGVLAVNVSTPADLDRECRKGDGLN